MREIHVNVFIDAPIERVFDAVSDHERFLSNRETATTLVQPGTTERNGLGALREVVVSGRIRYLEEITSFERPTSFAYLIREGTLPMRHHGSGLTFTPRGEGTEVSWTGRFEIPSFILDRLFGAYVRNRLTLAFTELLRAAKARLEARSEN